MRSDRSEAHLTDAVLFCGFDPFEVGSSLQMDMFMLYSGTANQQPFFVDTVTLRSSARMGVIFFAGAQKSRNMISARGARRQTSYFLLTPNLTSVRYQSIYGGEQKQKHHSMPEMA